jgi:dTMP kinase
MKGLFITFEGCDGLGKSGQVRLLVDELNRRGLKVCTTKEPGSGLPGGGSPFGPLVRDAVFHLKASGRTFPPDAKQLYLLVDHIDNVSRFLPFLEAGETVVCDRYTDSAFAYAAVHTPPTSPAMLRMWKQFRGPDPDISVLLYAGGRRVIDPVYGVYENIGWALDRARKRIGLEEGKQQAKGWNDYAAQRLIQRGYLALLSAQERSVIVRVVEHDTELEVHRRVMAAVDKKLANIPHLARCHAVA